MKSDVAPLNGLMETALKEGGVVAKGCHERRNSQRLK